MDYIQMLYLTTDYYHNYLISDRKINGLLIRNSGVYSGDLWSREGSYISAARAIWEVVKVGND
jgi:hypothetical protein